MVKRKKDHRVIDAEWIAHYFGTTHLVAKADPTQNCLEPLKLLIDYEVAETFVEQRWKYKDKNKVYRQGTMG
jgi:hypothetical protein